MYPHNSHKRSRRRREDVDDVHLFAEIHEFTAYYQLLMLLILVIMGTSYIPFFYGPYFDFGAPLNIMTTTVSGAEIYTALVNNAVFVAVLLFVVFDRSVATLYEEVSALRPDAPGMLGKAIASVVHWLRYALTLILLRAQVTFLIAYVVIDIIVFYVMKTQAVARRMFSRDGAGAEGGRDTLMIQALLFAQVIELPCFMVIFLVTGIFQTNYFVIGPDLIIFSQVVTSLPAYVIIAIISFADQFLASYVRNVIDDWHVTVLQNASKGHDDDVLTRAEAICIFVVKRLIMWLRVIFVVNFMLSQFFFVIIYAVADLAATLVVAATSSARSKQTIILIMVAQAAETLILLIVLIIPRFIDITYFRWLREATIFGNVISGQNLIALLLTYVGFERIGATLYNDVVVPDYTNWLYGGAKHMGYSFYVNIMVLGVTRFDYWIRFLMLIQFVLSNVYFVVISAGVDIIVGSIVIARHIKYKDKKLASDRVYYMLLSDAFTSEEIYDFETVGAPT
jgi:hypothetical protein